MDSLLTSPILWAVVVALGIRWWLDTLARPNADGASEASASNLRRILRYVSLRPYGRSLLTPAASFWIVVVRQLIFIMAITEGLSWGYASFYLATGWARWISGAFALVSICSIVWILDASLMTLDRWSPRHDPVLVSRESDAGRLKSLLQWLSLIARGGMVATSLYLTAPFMAQVLFADDIGRALEAERLTIRAAKRESLLAPLKTREQDLQKKLDDLKKQLEREVAGKGDTGLRGVGDTANQLQKHITGYESEMRDTQRKASEEARAFDALTHEQVSAKYNVVFPGDSLQERGRVLDRIANENYRLTETTIRGFLGFIFLGIVVLKIFEPSSVKIYFAERLQDLYAQYKRGAFDAWLAPHERSKPANGMQALRFEDWCLNTYPAVRKADAARAAAGDRTAFYDTAELELAQTLARVKQDEAPLLAEYQRLQAALKQVCGEELSTRQAREDAEQKYKELAQRRALLERTLTRCSSPPAIVSTAEAFEDVDQQFIAAQTLVAQLTARHETLSAQCSELKAQLAPIQAALETLRRVRTHVESQIAQLRLQQLGEVVGTAQERGGRRKFGGPGVASNDRTPEPPTDRVM